MTQGPCPPNSGIPAATPTGVRIRAAALLTGGLVLAALCFTGVILYLPIRCRFHDVTGIPCPTCGMTHAVMALVQGRWVEAGSYHMGVFALAGLGVLLALTLIYELVTGRDILGGISARLWLMLVLAAVGATGLGWTINLWKLAR